jgi:hypothetical protein
MKSDDGSEPQLDRERGGDGPPFEVDPVHFLRLLQAETAECLLCDAPELMLAHEGKLTVHWIPSDHIARSARLAIVGITPGHQQANNFLNAFRYALEANLPLDAALRHAKRVASFSGARRINLVRMLDSIGMHAALGIPGCAALFESAHELVHFTSVLRYPVFIDGKNYSGNPDFLRTPLLKPMLESFFAGEVRALPDAVWLPLGPMPTVALKHIVRMGLLPADRVLEGMPHPSGANAERIKFFLGRKSGAEFSRQTRPEPIEAARNVLLAQVVALRDRWRLGSLPRPDL